MIPSSFNEANLTLTPPRGVSEDECASIRVFRGKDTAGRSIIIQRWKLTTDEIQALTDGESIWVVIWGDVIPPLSLQAHKPI